LPLPVIRKKKEDISMTRIQRDVLIEMRKGIYRAGGMICLTVAISAGNTYAQVAGSSTIGVTQEEVKMVARGWSAKKKILGKAVYNDAKQKVGTVDDLIITPEKSVSYAIIGVGGFLGMGKHDVAIPVNQLKADQDRIILPGATKEALKAMPTFEYAK
jgi:sporulation protein YlmC with PRC-barrel domain